MKSIIDIIFPKKCINCNKIEDYICNNCKKKLTPFKQVCPICKKYFPDNKICPDCKNAWIYLEGVIIWFNFDKIIKKIIHNIKYYHKFDFCKFLWERLILAILSNQSISENFTISYVPVHPIKKIFIRWYNQSKLISISLLNNKFSNNLNLSYNNFWKKPIKIVKKYKYTKSQLNFDKQKRSENQIWSFKLIKENYLIWNETIIIVDDIFTTWSTLNEIAKTIKENYPNIKIRWAVIASN